MNSKIPVEKALLVRVVPMMKLRCGEQLPNRAVFKPQIRVDKGRMNAYKNDVSKERAFGEPQDIDRHICDATGQDDIDEMQSRAGEPVHCLGRMMNSVKSPEQWYGMKGSVNPILNQI